METLPESLLVEQLPRAPFLPHSRSLVHFLLGCRAAQRRRILEIGCGRKSPLLPILKDLWPDSLVHQIDAQADVVAAAAQHNPEGIVEQMRAADLSSIPAGSMDLVIAMSVFDQNPVDILPKIAQEVHRVLSSDGIVVYIHNEELNLPATAASMIAAAGEPRLLLPSDRWKPTNDFEYCSGARTEIESAIHSAGGTMGKLVEYLQGIYPHVYGTGPTGSTAGKVVVPFLRSCTAPFMAQVRDSVSMLREKYGVELREHATAQLMDEQFRSRLFDEKHGFEALKAGVFELRKSGRWREYFKERPAARYFVRGANRFGYSSKHAPPPRLEFYQDLFQNSTPNDEEVCFVALQYGLVAQKLHSRHAVLATGVERAKLRGVQAEAGIGLTETEQSNRLPSNVDPTNADELFQCGVEKLKQRRFSEAAALFQNATSLRPDFAEAWNNLGIALASQSRFQPAADAFRRAAAWFPDRADIQRNLGTALRDLGSFDGALRAFEESLRLEPASLAGLLNLADLYRRTDQSLAAVECLHRILGRQPNCAAALSELDKLIEHHRPHARASDRDDSDRSERSAQARELLEHALGLVRDGQLPQAVDAMREAISTDPASAMAFAGLSSAFIEMGRYSDARASLQTAILLDPTQASLYLNLGSVHQRLEKPDAAIACYRQAIRLEPSYVNAHFNLATVYSCSGQYSLAIPCFQEAIRLKSDFFDAHLNLATSYFMNADYLESIQCCERALQLNPADPAVLCVLVHQMQNICRWDGIMELSRRAVEAVSRRPMGSLAGPFPFYMLTLPSMTSAAEQLRSASNFAQQCLVKSSSCERPAVRPMEKRNRSKIRVGYLSGDFREHPVGYQIAELIELHDRERFEIVAYSYGSRDGSRQRERLRRAFDRFVDIQYMGTAESARRIASDEVDVLVDLTGYTMDARPEVLALRPAPIQVNYFGFSGTMGASFIDYILVDDFLVPSAQQPFFSEQLVSLPSSFMVCDSRREISSYTPSRKNSGLPESAFVFCCFNGNYKITPTIFDVWIELLRAIPESVLWLFEGNPAAPDNLRCEAANRGVAQERLVFAPSLPSAEHLPRYRLADLFLDTLPYNAHTTACEALWMGCPVLTIAGETFCSRVAGSLLRAVGLNELITYNIGDYKRLALEVAHDRSRLSELRSRLAEARRSSSLFDTARNARKLERAYIEMVGIHLSGAAPRPITVKSD